MKKLLLILLCAALLIGAGCKSEQTQEIKQTKAPSRPSVEGEMIEKEAPPSVSPETQTEAPQTETPQTETPPEEPEEEYKYPRRVRDDFPVINIGQIWAYITIEDAGVYNIPVYHGDNEDDMLRGVGHTLNSRFPGQNGRIVIPGHVGIYRFFQRLENLTAGAIVKLDTIYGEYVYEVYDTVIFQQNDLSYVSPLEEELEDQLVCFACYPYRTNTVRTQRFAILCRRISGEDWTEYYEK